MKALLIGVLALSMAPTSMPGVSPETLALLDRTPRVASPLAGYLTLGDYFARNGQWDRAKQIFAYGLLYSPTDARFLGKLARAEQALGHREYAREYALSALAYSPSHPDAQEVLLALGPAPSPSPSPSADPPTQGDKPDKPAPSPEADQGKGGASPAASPSPAGSPGPSASPSPGASPSPSASPSAVRAIDKSVVAQLAVALGAKGPEELANLRAAGPLLDTKLLGDKLKALSVLKSVDAALKMYKLNHKKEEIKALDLKKLVEDKVLPRELDLSIFPGMKLDDGKLSMDGFGEIGALEGELKEYREGLEKAARHREKGLTSESHQVLSELVKKFPGDPELYARLLRIQLELGLDFPAADTARKLFLLRPSDPAHLWALAVLYFRSSRPDQARQLAVLLPKVYQDSFYTPSAKALVALVDSGASFESIQKLVEERATAEPEPEPGPEASASPSPSPGPSAAASPAPSPSAR